MSILQDNPVGFFSFTSQYQIQRSLRFNSDDSAYLSRTPASAGNRKTWTWSGWIKRLTAFGALNILFSSGADGSNNLRVGFETSDKFFVSNEAAGVTTTLRLTTAIYRDPGAWMHIVLAVDTTLATAADRVKLYVNGAEVTAFDTSNNPTQNADLNCNNAGTFYIGRNFATNYLNAYLADVHFISGSALTPSSFGETDATTGEWVPKTFSGSYGTNGHKLTFSDNSAATAAALGADTSGGGNNFTPNNLSVTAGVGNDSLVDTPTSYGTDTGTGGEVRGNYFTLNFLDKNANITPANGNLDLVGTGTTHRAIRSTFAVSSGKWYWEATVNSYSSGLFGIAKSDASLADGQYIGANATSWGYIGNGNKYNNGSSAGYGASFTTGDVIGVALDADNGTLVFYKNGSSQGTAYTGLTSGPYFPAVSTYSSSDSYSFNFGQRPFAYTAPSGFKALCDTNLPAPTIVKPSTVMDTVLYNGTGSALTPTSSLGFSPDLVWIKCRSVATTDHALYDTVRGAQARLESNNTDAEVTTDNGLTAFNSNGFTLGTLAQVNTFPVTYAAWCWDAGSSTVTNTAGTISSQVRANASAGFSIVTYTGTGANATVGHGLGVAPQLIIVKNRSAVTDWTVQHMSVGAGRLQLNTTAAYASSTGSFQDQAPTSTVFSVGTFAATNGSTNSMVAYCFAPVAGYSAFGSYTGNGSADGPFVYTGFRPRWVLIKQTNAGTESWILLDSARATYNQLGEYLNPNLSAAAASTGLADFLSNGFKLRVNTGAATNANAGTYIYAAFAEFPFQTSRAR